MYNVRYKSNDNYVVSEVAGESVIVPMSGSVAKMGSLIVLNETGSFIISCMKEPSTVSEIAKAMANEYDVPEETELCADIQQFIDAMVKRGFFSVEK